MTITPTQNKVLHALLNSTKMTSSKADLVLGFTQGRSESSRDLTMQEAQEFINYLKQLDNHAEAANTMRRKILSMCHRIKWEHEDGKVDLERLNNWCRTRSYLKKELNAYQYKELPKLVAEFQQVYKHYLNKVS